MRSYFLMGYRAYVYIYKHISYNYSFSNASGWFKMNLQCLGTGIDYWADHINGIDSIHWGYNGCWMQWTLWNWIYITEYIKQLNGYKPPNWMYQLRINQIPIAMLFKLLKCYGNVLGITGIYWGISGIFNAPYNGICSGHGFGEKDIDGVVRPLLRFARIRSIGI